MYIYTQNGSIFIGRVAQDATHQKVGASDTDLTKFSISYAKNEKDGKSSSLYMNVVAWGKLARNVAGLEKGDVVIVCGEIETQTYRKKDGTDGKSTQLTAEFILVQPQYTNGLPPDRDKLASDYGSAYQSDDEAPDIALPF